MSWRPSDRPTISRRNRWPDDRENTPNVFEAGNPHTGQEMFEKGERKSEIKGENQSKQSAPTSFVSSGQNSPFGGA